MNATVVAKFLDRSFYQTLEIIVRPNFLFSLSFLLAMSLALPLQHRARRRRSIEEKGQSTNSSLQILPSTMTNRLNYRKRQRHPQSHRWCQQKGYQSLPTTITKIRLSSPTLVERHVSHAAKVEKRFIIQQYHFCYSSNRPV